MKKFVAVIFTAFLFLQLGNSQVVAQELQYQVKAGDCLWSIANQHGVSVDYIKKLNNLTADSLQVGDLLNISGETVTVASTTTPSRGQDSSAAVEEYTVKAGDSLYQIAADHKTSVEAIMRGNHLSSFDIYPGQKLQVSPGQVATPSRAGSLATVNQILAKAAEHLGTPYKYGGQAPGGFDCSGFVCYIFNQFGYNLPHNAAAQTGHGLAITKSDLIAGDLVFFGSKSSINHVGIYSGNGQFIHSSSPRSGGVIYSSLNEGYYSRNYVTARRIIR
jgi:cell wall-associated NlpC family hydrolase